MNKEEFRKKVEELGLKLTIDLEEKLDTYCTFLLEYNNHTNLTAIRNTEDVYLKHFYDSLTLTKVIDLKEETTLLDIGSGAGFPGMVLKLFFPNLHVTLVDSNNKKTKFLELLQEKLDVDNLQVINTRIEAITKDNLNSFDVVTARAVTNLPVLLELAIPLVKVNKYFIAMKGNSNEELENSKYAISKLGCSIDTVENFKIYEVNGERMLIKIKKNQETDAAILRPYEKIIKKPLQKPLK